jgi:hypothetical protein
MKIKPVERLWQGASCIVAASGPSLSKAVAWKIRSARWFDHWKVIAVNDAYTLLRCADILYAADWCWWKQHDGVKDFHGQRWTCHSTSLNRADDKSEVARVYPLQFVEGRDGIGFADAGFIHYGNESHSGFQAINLALILGCTRVVLCGFDMQRVNGQAHFFGEHPDGLRRSQDGFKDFLRAYSADDRIVNATPGSAIKCYKAMDLDEALRRDDSLHRHRAKPNAGADRISTG